MHAQIVIKIKLIIQLALGIAMLAATISNQALDTESTNVDTKTQSEITATIETQAEAPTKNSKQTTEQIVRDYFSDAPIMIDVARCESQFRQNNPDGSTLRGRVNSQDVGVMQINEKYHAATALKLGIDLYTIEGNMDYARYLYETQGTAPWVHSSKCWNKVREVAVNN